jgi:hypothetical protein
LQGHLCLSNPFLLFEGWPLARRTGRSPPPPRRRRSWSPLRRRPPPNEELLYNADGALLTRPTWRGRRTRQPRSGFSRQSPGPGGAGVVPLPLRIAARLLLLLWGAASGRNSTPGHGGQDVKIRAGPCSRRHLKDVAEGRFSFQASGEVLFVPKADKGKKDKWMRKSRGRRSDRYGDYKGSISRLGSISQAAQPLWDQPYCYRVRVTNEIKAKKEKTKKKMLGGLQRSEVPGGSPFQYTCLILLGRPCKPFVCLAA